jgi:hypothetical protein
VLPVPFPAKHAESGCKRARGCRGAAYTALSTFCSRILVQ